MIRRFSPYLAALAAVSTLALAVPSVQAHQGQGPRGEMRGEGGGRLFRGLDLTQEQRDQARKIFQEQAPAMRDRMEAAHKARQELRAMSLSPNFDSNRARELAEAAAKAQAEAAVIRAEGMSKMFALLTPDQRAKLEERRQHREHRGRR